MSRPTKQQSTMHTSPEGKPYVQELRREEHEKNNNHPSSHSREKNGLSSVRVRPCWAHQNYRAEMIISAL
jgi:hypothetical protein